MDAKSGKTFAVEDPATEQHLVDVAEACAVDAAVASAWTASESRSWSGISPTARGRLLLRIADLVARDLEELSIVESLDNGTQPVFTRLRKQQVADTFRYYAGRPTKIHGTTNTTDDSRLIFALREPMDVCALFNAWNVPLVMAGMNVAPALACGNTAVLKPAEQAPLSTMWLGDLMQEAGVPLGVVNILPGFGATAGAAMEAHPGVDKIVFTGSTGVGKQILHASIVNLKKVTLELGGKSPNIVFPDADLDKAAEAAAVTVTRNSDQMCSAGTRLIVHESIHGEMAERVMKIARGFKVGSPFDADTELGPLVSARQMKRVLSYIAAGQEEGAQLGMGGKRLGARGFYVEPTVVTHVSNGMTTAREEMFGPVLSIIAFADEGDVVSKANDTEYGLASAVWTHDVSRVHRVSRGPKVGRVWINTYAEGDVSMPIGGYKQSGVGREFGAESIEAYTQTKSVLLKL